MATNKDGLEPGQPVDFATHQRILSEQKARLKNGNSDESKPKRARRKAADASEDNDARLEG